MGIHQNQVGLLRENRPAKSQQKKKEQPPHKIRISA